ncbi:GpE family phage tail protein [Novosphingobium sp.]
MMADIAAVFHWPPDVLEPMNLIELARWQKLAVKRFKDMRGVE